MDGFVDTLKSGFRQLIEIGVWVILLALLAWVLFGDTVPFLQSSIVGNFLEVLAALDEAGVVGIVAIGIVYWIVRNNNINVDPRS